LGGDEDEGAVNNSSPKFIIFFAGGISYSEIRAIRNLESVYQNVLTVIGATSFLKPNDFVEGLIQMKDTM
jgi:hypothetical protein